MATLAQLLEGAATHLQAQISNATNRGAVVPAHLYQAEKGITQVLQAAQQEAPANHFILAALSRMELLNQSPTNAVRNAAQAGHGATVGHANQYVAELQTVLNLVKQAQPLGNGGAGAVMAAARAAWTMQDWQRNDSAGLTAMMQANTSEWQQLYKRETGTDYTPHINPNKSR